MNSIVQIPTLDLDCNPTETRIDAAQTDWLQTKKRIGDWFHFSLMGFGHSEALGKMNHSRLPRDTKYEAAWWVRKVHRDGFFHGRDYDKDFALSAATTYAEKVSIGNLTLFRQFLTTSLKRSERPWVYLEAFPQMLTAKGRDVFSDKIRRCLQITKLATSEVVRIWSTISDQVIRLLCGFTRKREYLVPEWADDSKLWSFA